MAAMPASAEIYFFYLLAIFVYAICQVTTYIIPEDFIVA
jgi:hypothetical protein